MMMLGVRCAGVRASSSSTPTTTTTTTLQHPQRRRLFSSSSMTSVDGAPQSDYVSVGAHARHGERVLEVRMTRAKLHNAFDEQFIAALTAAFHFVSSQRACRAVLFSGGDGKSFSAGADLRWMQRMADYSEAENRADSLRLFDMFFAVKACPAPVVARVNGAALGGGAGLVACADIPLALDRAVLGFTETRLGLIPAVISPFVVEKIGKGAALRYFATAERFSAARAREIGLVQEHCATLEELDAAVERTLDALCANSPQAVRAAKRLADGVHARLPGYTDNDGAAVREYTAAAIARIRVSPEGQEGLRAFLEQRQPDWDKFVDGSE